MRAAVERVLQFRPSRVDVIAALSLVNLVLLDVWRLLFLAASPSSFYLTLSAHDYVAAVGLVTVGGMVLACGAAWVRRCSDPVRRLACAVTLLTVLLVADAIRRSAFVYLPDVVQMATALRRSAGTPILLVAALALAALVLRYAVALARGYRAVLIAISPFVVVNFVHAAWVLSHTDFRAFDNRPLVTGPASTAPHRVVLIVFDELDNEVAFTRRPSDLQLRHFDAFREEAVVFENASPPAANTAESMISLLAGARVSRIDAQGPSQFRAIGAEGPVTDATPTFFAVARSVWERNALVGFFLPYCRLPMAETLARCFAAPFVTGGSVTRRDAGVFDAAISQVASLFPLNGRLVHIRLYHELLAQATDAAGDRTLGLVVLHMPLPHLPPIYDRRTGRFTITRISGYVDNVALADVALGAIREAMERANVWRSTTVIVTADHSWRRKYAELGSRDTRIPLLIKLADQRGRGRVATPVESTSLGRLAIRLLRGEISTAPELESSLTSVDGSQ